MKHIMKCPECEKFTMKEECCTRTITTRPPKYSPDDKYKDIKREAKKDIIKKRGLI